MMKFIFFLFGILFGSFFNVCIYRIPLGSSIVYPSSHCTSCNKKLKTVDIIPVFSYIFLRGKCRNCNEPVSIQYPIVEILTGILFSLLYMKYSFTSYLLIYILLTSILIIVAFIDLKHRIIPNSLVLFGTVIAMVSNLLCPHLDWLDGFLGLVVGGGTLLTVSLFSLIFLKKEGMGGGDIKLMGMIGLFLGWRLTLLSLILTIYIGGIVGGILLIFRIKKVGENIPFGPFIAIGSEIAMLFGAEIIRWYLSTIS